MAGQFRVSRWGTVPLVVVALIVWPAVTLTTVWKTGLFEPDPPGWAWGILAFVVLVLPALGWPPLAELRTARRTRFEDDGLTQGGTRIAWSEITSLKMEQGVAELCSHAGRIRVATYLFEDRDAVERLLETQAREAGVEPEIAR